MFVVDLEFPEENSPLRTAVSHAPPAKDAPDCLNTEANVII